MIKFYSCIDGLEEHETWQPQFWVNAECPDADDRLFMAERIGVPEEFLEALSDLDELPRFDRSDGWMMAIMRVPIKHDSALGTFFSTMPLGILTRDEVVLTICPGLTEMIPDFIEDSRRRHITIDNKADFLLRLIYSATHWYLEYLKTMSNIVGTSITDLQSDLRNSELLKLMQLQKSLVYFNTSLAGNSSLIRRITTLWDDACDKDLLEDVEIEIEQAMNTVNVYNEILENTMATFASIASNNVNQIMKKLTGISIILMIPTLIASFYGMNVNVWSGNAPFAFWIIIIAAFLLSLAIFLWLRRIRWI